MTEKNPPAAERTSSPLRTSPARSALRTWLPLALILLAGLLLRIFYLAEIAERPDFTRPAADAGFHNYWARALLTGDWKLPRGEGDPRIPEVPFLRPPGYPYFLAAAYALTKGSFAGARAVQMAFGLLNALLAFLLGRALLGRAVGLVLAGFSALYWGFIYFEGELLPPVLLVAAALLLFLALHSWQIRPRLRSALLGGALLGAAVLLRGNDLVFLPFALAWIVRTGRRAGAERPLLHAAVFLAGTAAAILPATLRNAAVSGEFCLVSCNAPITLYIANNESSDGVSSRFPDLAGLTGMSGWSWFSYDRIVEGLSRREGREMKYSDASSFFVRKAFAFAAEHPGKFLALTFRKAALFFGPAEISNNKAIQFEKRESRVLRWNPSFPFVGSASLLGFFLLLRDRRRGRKPDDEAPAFSDESARTLRLILLYVGVLVLSYLPFLAAARFRVPLLPLVFLPGAYAVARIVRALRAREPRRTALLLLGWGLLYVLTSFPLTPYEPDPAWGYTDRGMARVRAGDPAGAVLDFEAGLRANPGSIDARLNLARTLAQLGRGAEAIVHYREIARARPDRVDARLRLARLLLENGEGTEAARELEELAAAAPHLPEAHSELGRALLSLRKPDLAAQAFRKALDLDPGRTAVFVNLGLAYAGQGLSREAIASYRDALAIDGRLAEAHFHLGNAWAEIDSLDRAQEAYEEAIRSNPRYMEAFIHQGNVLSRRGRFEDAIGKYRAALAIDGRNTVARCNLAAALGRQGKIEEAIAELEKVLAIDPNQPTARAWLAALGSSPGR